MKAIMRVWATCIKALICAAPSMLMLLVGQPLPVLPLRTTDLDQLARSLREQRPLMPVDDCKALDIWECHPDEPRRSTDLSLRWVQLDDDPELECVLVTEAKSEIGYVAFVFDRLTTWNLVGRFFDRRARDGQDLVRVQRLTDDSPPFLLVRLDLGGSGSMILTTEVFQLRDGKLWPVTQITDNATILFPGPLKETQHLLTAPGRLIVHSIQEKPPGRVVERRCEVFRWDPQKHELVPEENERRSYCDLKTGKPISGKSTPMQVWFNP